MKPSNVTPAAITQVWITSPTDSHYMTAQCPVATFIYEEKGKLKAWCGYKITDLAKNVLIEADSLIGKDHAVFTGYIAPLAFLYVTLYDDNLELRHSSAGILTVQQIAFDLAQGAAKIQHKAQYYLDHRAEIDARTRQRVVQMPIPTSGPSPDEVYPRRDGYVGD